MVKKSCINNIEVIEHFPDIEFSSLDKKMMAQNVSSLLEVFANNNLNIDKINYGLMAS